MSQPDPTPARDLLDTVSTVALLVLVVLLWGFLTFVGAFSAMASDACGSGGSCDDTVMNVGWYGAVISPTLIGLVVAGWTTARLISGRPHAFAVPLIGGVVMAATSFGFLALLVSGTS